MTGPLLLRILVPLLLCAPGFFPPAYASLQKQEVQPSKAILRKDPKSGREFKSWALFLVCNPEWLASEKEADLNDLYLSFGHFGEAIGDNNLAVWFWKAKAVGNNKHADVGNTVDVTRSSEFCSDWELTPSRGPHLVVTTTYPEVETFPGPTGEPLRVPRPLNEESVPRGLLKGSAVWELGNMKPAEIHKLLAGLTDVLLQNRKVTTQHVQP